MTPENQLICRASAMTLRKLRRKTGIAQERLALESGVNRGYMSGLERGLHSPTLGTIQKLLPRLGVTFPEFAAEFESALRRVRRQPLKVTC